MPTEKSKPQRSKLPAILIVLAVVGCALGGWWFAKHRSGAGKIENVLLISIDTCRADRLSCYGFGRPTTPHIDAVAKDGVVFEQALSPIPLTTPAHSSMLTGLYPPAHGVRLNNGDRLVESNVTLAEKLREAGFQTAAFVGGLPLDAKFGTNQGFDTYDCQFTRTSERSITLAERNAEEVTRPALTWLDKHAEKPFFMFLHYYDAHFPYESPPQYTAICPDDPYAAQLGYVDHWIGQVLERLKSLNAYDDTLVVITADHGESLGEHGEHTHGVFVYQCTLHVPFVVRVPGGKSGTRVVEKVSLVDVTPTILDLVGAKAIPQIQGITLRAALEGTRQPDRLGPIYCESLNVTPLGCSPLNGVVDGSWKYIRAPKQELYDLVRDPTEQTNLVESNAQIAERLRDRLESLLKQSESLAPKGKAATVDAETMRRLAGIGYVGGGAITGSNEFDPTLEDPKDFQATYERILHANDLFLEGRNADARRELSEIIAARPKLVTPRAILAQLAVNERKFDEAAQGCAAIVSILKSSKPISPPIIEPIPGKLDTRDIANAEVNLALMLTEANKGNEAVAHYEEALRIRPEYAEAHFNFAVLLARLGRSQDAMREYEAALKITPNYIGAHLNLGSALLQANKVNEAITHFEAALRLDPNFADAHFNLGIALQQVGRNPEALFHYEAVLKLRPDYARVNPHFNEVLAAARKSNGLGPK